jgi:hypothetical protein
MRGAGSSLIPWAAAGLPPSAEDVVTNNLLELGANKSGSYFGPDPDSVQLRAE